MKLALIVIHSAAGWAVHAVGGDGCDNVTVADVKTAFKQLKVDGVLALEAGPADRAFYFDTGGNVKRKLLDDPEEKAEVDAANDRIAQTEEQDALTRLNESIAAQAHDQAKSVAEKAVDLIAKQIAGESTSSKSPVVTAAPVETSAPVVPAGVTNDGQLAPENAPRAVSPIVVPGAENAQIETDPETHFGARKGSKSKSAS